VCVALGRLRPAHRATHAGGGLPRQLLLASVRGSFCPQHASSDLCWPGSILPTAWDQCGANPGGGCAWGTNGTPDSLALLPAPYTGLHAWRGPPPRTRCDVQVRAVASQRRGSRGRSCSRSAHSNGWRRRRLGAPRHTHGKGPLGEDAAGRRKRSGRGLGQQRRSGHCEQQRHAAAAESCTLRAGRDGAGRGRGSGLAGSRHEACESAAPPPPQAVVRVAGGANNTERPQATRSLTGHRLRAGGWTRPGPERGRPGLTAGCWGWSRCLEANYMK
jgi:hypothetical protein